NSYDLIGLNGEIEALDGRIAGKLQLELFAAVQDLLLDRIVWFLRHVDLDRGLAAVIEHYQSGIAAVAAALDGVLTHPARTCRGRGRPRSSPGPACRSRWRDALPTCRG